MANVTLAIDDDLLRESRAYAQKHGTSVNQMFRDHLSGIIGKKTTRKAQWQAQIDQIGDEMASQRKANPWKWNRDEAHERGSPLSA